jgi:hypothetical protein
MFAIPSSYATADTKGICPAQFITLAKNVWLDALPVKNQDSEQDLFDYLRNSGPVWSAGFWFGVGHVIVLTGVDRGQVYFNDPGGGAPRNRQMVQGEICLAVPGLPDGQGPTTIPA